MSSLILPETGEERGEEERCSLLCPVAASRGFSIVVKRGLLIAVTSLFLSTGSVVGP